MPSHPNGPRPVSRTVRNDLKVAESDLDMADKKLNRIAENDSSAAQAQSLVRGAIIIILRILGLGTDDSDNGNGDHA